MTTITTTTTMILFGTLAACGTTITPTTDRVAIIDTTVIDERADQIAFTEAGPVHTHVGPEVELASGACPEIYKYAYLTDQGRDNPIELRFASDAAGDARYRVRDANGATLLPWTDAVADGDDFVAELHRHGAHPIAALDHDAELHVDLAIGDATTTRCLRYHALGAPLAFGPADVARVLGRSALVNDTLADDGSEIAWMFGETGPYLYVQNVGQYSAEPVDLDVELDAPIATYSESIVDAWIEPGIHLGDAPTTARSGAFAGNYAVGIVDRATGETPSWCPYVGRGLHCTIPGRLAGRAPGAYAIVGIVDRVTAIAPAPAAPGDLGQYTLDGTSFVGVRPWETDGGRTHLQAISALGITFGATRFTATANGNPISYAPAATFALPGFIWNAGTAPMPGR